MTSSKQEFRKRMLEQWLPAFCNDDKRGYGTDGFRPDWDRVSSFDAQNFLSAIDSGVVWDTGGGRYRCDRSNANEQIFWEGLKSISPRPISIWVEPIVTIATVGRLVTEFGWNPSLIGMQSKDWAFDFTVHLPFSPYHEFIAGEVKKNRRELDTLLSDFHSISQAGFNNVDRDRIKTNSWKKALALIERRPPYFWAVAPDNYTKLYKVIYDRRDQIVFEEVPLDSIHASKHRTLSSLFFPDTEWGMPGDPYLFDEMREHFQGYPLPTDPAELESFVVDYFSRAVGVGIDAPDDATAFVERRAHDGMKSEGLRPRAWRETILPELKQRLLTLQETPLLKGLQP